MLSLKNGVFEHDETFAKLSVSGLEEQDESHSLQVIVLGMKWDCETDDLCFDFYPLWNSDFHWNKLSEIYLV